MHPGVVSSGVMRRERRSWRHRLWPLDWSIKAQGMATFMRLIPTAAVLPGVIKREKYAVLPLWPMVIYMSAASTGQYMRSLKKFKIVCGILSLLVPTLRRIGPLRLCIVGAGEHVDVGKGPLWLPVR